MGSGEAASLNRRPSGDEADKVRDGKTTRPLQLSARVVRTNEAHRSHVPGPAIRSSSDGWPLAVARPGERSCALDRENPGHWLATGWTSLSTACVSTR